MTGSDTPRLEEIEIAHARNAGWCWRCWRCDHNVFNLTEEEARRQAGKHAHWQVPDA